MTILIGRYTQVALLTPSRTALTLKNSTIMEVVINPGCKFFEKSNHENEETSTSCGSILLSSLESRGYASRSTRLSPIPLRRFTRGGGHNVVDPSDLPGFVRVRPHCDAHQSSSELIRGSSGFVRVRLDGRRLTAV